MENLFINFRNYLKAQNADFLIGKNWKTLKEFFLLQGINIDKFHLETFDDILMLQSVFNQKSLRQFQAGSAYRQVGIDASFILWQFGQFLVSQSCLSDNPAEKIGLFELLKGDTLNKVSPYQPQKGATLTKYFLRPALVFAVVFFILSFVFRLSFKYQSGDIEISALPLVKKVFASEEKQSLELITSLFEEEKIVSSSAKTATNTYNQHRF